MFCLQSVLKKALSTAHGKYLKALHDKDLLGDTDRNHLADLIITTEFAGDLKKEYVCPLTFPVSHSKFPIANASFIICAGSSLNALKPF